MHLFTVAMVWHDEPIKILVCPPTGTQVREYMASRGRCPSIAQVQIPGGEVLSQSSTSDPHLQLHVVLRDLNDAQLREVLDEIQLETSRREGTAPPIRSPFGQWWGPVGGVDASLDDGKVTLQGGTGWVPSKLVQWPTGAPQTEDVGCLLCTLMARLRLGTPRINTFSGDTTPGKTKVSCKQWYQEVQCIKDHYSESVVWENIIRSLKGAVADMVQYMGPTTSVAHILWKHFIIFGTVASFDVLMQNFYKVTQGNNKKVPSFAMRLEGTLN